jgi:DUF1680 family protein
LIFLGAVFFFLFMVPAMLFSKKMRFVFGASFLCGALACADIQAEGNRPAALPVSKAKRVVADEWNALPYGEVKVGGEIGRRIDITINNNLKKLDLERDFLGAFKEKRGDAGDFIGTGMLLDAAVRFAAHTGDPELVAIKKKIAGQLVENQLSDGYTGHFPRARRLWRSWDFHEMAYIINGLLSDYRFFGEKKSLDAAVKTAGYMLDNWHKKPRNFPDFYMLGIDKAMVSLYELTGEERFWEFGENKKPIADLPPIVKGRNPPVSGHIFAYLAKGDAQLDKYRFQPDKKLLSTLRAMRFLTAEDGLSVIGGAGQEETWTDDHDGEGHHGETCATAYMMRVYDNLLRLGGESAYGDLMERSLYNALFAAQTPDGRRMRYYIGFEGARELFDKDSYCCPNNYRRIISELPRMIYYVKPEGGIAVNLYTESSASVTFADGATVGVSQETDYPNTGKVSIALKLGGPREFPLSLRIPAWAKSRGNADVSVKINGVPAGEKIEAGRFLHLHREWKNGDRVEIDFPMEVRFVAGRKRQFGRVALLRGPQVYCFSRAANPSIETKESFQGLSKITLDPGSVKLISDAAVRKSGTALQAGAWAIGFNSKAGRHSYKLKLTEFADPAGVSIYFRMPLYRPGEEDELVNILADSPLLRSVE